MVALRAPRRLPTFLVVLAPYRITPWPELADDADVYEARLRKASSRLRLVVLGTCGAITAASLFTLAECHSRLRAYHRADSQRLTQIATVREVIGAARSFAVHEQARFSAAMNDALAAGPAENLAPAVCESRSSHPDLVVVDEDDREITSPSLASVLADATRAEERLTTGHVAEALAAANVLAHRIASSTAWPRYDAVLVTTSVHAPAVTTASTFEPGEVSGRVYLYDFSKHRVTCVGNAHAASSPQVDYSLTRSPKDGTFEAHLTARLDEDLHHQVRREVDRAELMNVDLPSDKTKREP